MGGVTDLSVLLANMSATLRPGEYVFSTVAGPEAATDVQVLASVTEPEGLSLVTTREQADGNGLAYDFVAAWITLEVHSALEAVGLTAAVSSALTEAGIRCNVVAGNYHDHLLVPVDRAQEALDVLSSLTATASGSIKLR